MQLILNSISTAAVNLLVFFRHTVSLVVFSGTGRKPLFFRWLGFIKPKLNGKWWTLVVFAIIYYFFYTFDLPDGSRRKPWITWKTAVLFP